MKKILLQFKPIDLIQYKQMTISMREDACICSFGNADLFWGENGPKAEKYLQFLKEKQRKDPLSAVHLWAGDVLVGQLEIGESPSYANTGYVSLYYLVPHARGKGFGRMMDDYAKRYFLGKGYKKAYLSVSPANTGAIQFYAKLGWRSLGTNPEKPELSLMEKIL